MFKKPTRWTIPILFGLIFTIIPVVTDAYTLDSISSTLQTIKQLLLNIEAQIAAIPSRSLTAQVISSDITTGLVGYWNFDEGSGTTAADSSGNNNTGTLVNGPTWVAGKIGSGALSFDGASGYLNVANSTGLTLDEFTVSAWVKTSNLATAYIISKDTSTCISYRNFWKFGLGYNTYLRSAVTMGNGSVANFQWTTDNSANNVGDGQWHLVTAVFTPGVSVKMYKDGNLIDTDTTTITGPFGVSTNPVKIGLCGNSGYFNGSLDDIRVYNRALTDQEITDLYHYAGSAFSSDITPPAVSISSPASGATVSGTTVITANASDNVGVASVQFQLDGVNLGSAVTSAPYTYSWDTTVATNDSHTLTAVVRDAAGNSTVSGAVTVTVNNTTVDTTPPIISSITSSSITSSSVTITWTTNEAADSQIDYGLTSSYGSQTTLNSTLTTSHSQSLSSLSASTLYHYRVRSKDSAGNLALSSDNTFTTAALTSTSANRVDRLDSSGSVLNTYTTIQACANVVIAGQSCLVYAGNYDERVTPVNSGTVGNPITFKSSTGTCVADSGTCPKVRAFTLTNKSYITVKGFEITSPGFTADTNRSVIVTTTSHVQILNNYIHDTTSNGIHARPWSGEPKSSFLLIRGNTLTNIGPYGNRISAMELWGDDTLIEQNDISHAEDAIRPMGSRYVIRNNTIHDFYVIEDPLAHQDGIQSFCNGGTPNEAVNYMVIENNNYHDNPDHDEHFALINGTATCGGSTTVILRGNLIYNVGEVSYIADANQAFGDHHKYYNNTTVKGTVAMPEHSTVALNGISNGSVLNNLFVDAIAISAPAQIYGLDTSGTSQGDYNLAYMTTRSITWSNPINAEPHHILNQNPLFVSNTDFHLQSASPAIDHGGPLTTVSSSDTGSGTTLLVNDAHFFQPGWAGVNPDWIAVGTTGNAAQISSIDYTTNTIILESPITRSVGQPVYLYKNSSGEQVLYGSAPDIGANEYNSGGVTTVLPASDTTAPSITTNLIATVISSSAVNLSWSPSTDSTGVTGYKIYRGGTQIGTSVFASYSDTGLTPATTYSYTVSAYDAAGNNSSQSSSVSATTASSLPVISNLAGGQTTDTSTTISWTTSVSTNGQVFYGTTQTYSAQSTLVDNNPKTTSHTITLTNLTPSTTYHFQAKSTDASAHSISTSDFTFITLALPAVPSPIISSFTASPSPATSGSSITLSWSVTGATSLSISNGLGNQSALSSGSITVSPTVTTTYTLTATNSGGSATQSVIVNISSNPSSSVSSSVAPSITSFTATPSSIISGQSSSLNFVATGNPTPALSISDIGISLTGSTSKTVNPLTTTTYTLTATNSAGVATAQVTITVTPFSSASLQSSGSGGSSGGGGGSAVTVYIPAHTSSSSGTAVTSINSNTSNISSLKNTTGKILTLHLFLKSKSNEVNTLQSILATDKSIYPEGLVTGYFGPATKVAVQKFQMKYNIALPNQDGFGEIGPKARAILNSLPGATLSAQSTNTPAATLTEDLSFGSSGAQVSLLQAILSKDRKVYPEGVINGLFGPATLRAVKRFQIKYNIVKSSSTSYGRVGPVTREWLNGR